jgi:nitrite reductase (NADH) large subunit
LVVIGNGMAGVRTVEEILSRNGAELFDITIFGNEPYGNYNRILLSNVLAGADDFDGIFLNPLDWYTENNIDLRIGDPVVRVDRFARVVSTASGMSMRYDRLIIATGSRSFFPPSTEC